MSVLNRGNGCVSEHECAGDFARLELNLLADKFRVAEVFARGVRNRTEANEESESGD